MSKKEIRSDGYTVFFENASFPALKGFLGTHTFSQVFILTDTNVKKHCLPLLLKSIPALKKVSCILLKPGEQHKNLQSCQLVWNALTQLQADRNALLINLGGGVVSDLGGFCASAYKRGITFINIPTTLLSMADASVGGKTGIDYNNYKNHIGTFSQPKGVFICTDFCKTQTKREFTNGMAEVLKAGFIASKKLAEQTASQKAPLNELIRHSVKIKNNIVLQDPKEKNLRKILNFGHTIGHAIESFYLGKKDKQLLHGEAIAMGMICESWIAVQLDLMKQEAFEWLQSLVDKLFKRVTLSPKDIPAVLHLMQQDKKNKAGVIRLAIIEKPGKPLLDVECSDALIKKALLAYTA